MNRLTPRVLLIGNTAHHEFREPIAWLRQHTQMSRAEDVSVALERWHDCAEPWHSIIVAQERPGCISTAEIERVTRAWPLSPVVALLGSWCEGETRSGSPWPGVVRVYWHQWIARCRTAFDEDLQPTSWQLPRTASEIERILHALNHVAPQGEGLVAVATRQAEFFHSLARVCRLAGYSSAWLSGPSLNRVEGAEVILWDGGLVQPQEVNQLKRLAELADPVPVIAILSFPRYDQTELLRQAGAAAVLSSPFLLPDLWSTLQRVRQATRHPGENGPLPLAESNFNTSVQL